MKRGTIWWVNLEPSHPPELGKVRPGVVVSNSEHNAILDSVVIVPASTQAPEIWPLRVQITLPTRKRSFAVLPGVRQVSKARLEQSIGVLGALDLERLDEALRLYLGE